MNHLELTLKAWDKLNFPKGMSVLDVGCRNDDNLKIFIDKGFYWMGCDIVGNRNVVEADMHNLPFPNMFDIVFCCHTFEHAQNPTLVLKQFKKALRHKGVIFISTPYHCDGQIINSGDFDHINVATELQMKKFFEYCGIKLIDQWIEKETEEEKNWSLITVGQVTKNGED